MSSLTERIKSLALSEGASLVGVAPAERWSGAPRGHGPTDLLRSARSVVVVALAFPRGLLDGAEHGIDPELIPDPEDRWQMQQQVFSPGGAGFCYPTLNWRLQMIAIRLATELENAGHDSAPLPASGFRAQDRYGLFSHRHAAVLAGLGEFGLNNLLLTPEYGPRVRLCSVLTAAPLEPDPLYDDPICLGEDCGLCLQARECFGQVYELEMAGKTMRLARFSGKCPAPACRDGRRPFIRYCYGVCPVGKKGKPGR